MHHPWARSLVAAGVAILAACAPATPPDRAPAASSPAPAGASATASSEDSPRARAERCARAGEKAAVEEPAVAMQTVVHGCLSVYRERGCRDAQLRAIDEMTDPSQRIRIITEGCRDAYCKKLPAPPLAMCSASTELELAAYVRASQEMLRAIRRFELGPDEANRVEEAFDRASKARAAAPR